MEERIEVNGIWYVKEEALQEELFISEFDGIVYENDLFSLEVTRLKDQDGIPTENILMEYTSKAHPHIKECWDNVDWMIGVYRNSPTSVRQLYPLMGEDRIRQIQSIIGTLVGKEWIKLKPTFKPDS
jgi:hypothetical protein